MVVLKPRWFATTAKGRLINLHDSWRRSTIASAGYDFPVHIAGPERQLHVPAAIDYESF